MSTLFVSVTELARYFKYLDNLRASGRTNMFGAWYYLRKQFPMTDNDAAGVQQAWIDTFDEGASPAARAERALKPADADFANVEAHERWKDRSR